MPANLLEEKWLFSHDFVLVIKSILLLSECVFLTDKIFFVVTNGFLFCLDEYHLSIASSKGYMLSGGIIQVCEAREKLLFVRFGQVGFNSDPSYIHCIGNA